MFTFLFLQVHISLYNVYPEAFVVVYKHVSMTSLFPLWKPMYSQSFMWPNVHLSVNMFVNNLLDNKFHTEGEIPLHNNRVDMIRNNHPST